MSKTNSHEDTILDTYLTNTLFVALCVGNPGETGDLATNEVPNSNAYDRAPIGASGWSTPQQGRRANIDVVQFPTPTGSWGLCTHFAVCSAGVPGVDDALYYGPLSPNIAPSSGANVNFPVGQLIVDED